MQVRVVRIFNTYGPNMALDDGRVVSNFVAQALTGQPLTIFGDGQQTRSFQYVSDLIEGERPTRSLILGRRAVWLTRAACCVLQASVLCPASLKLACKTARDWLVGFRTLSELLRMPLRCMISYHPTQPATLAGIVGQNDS